MRAIYLLVVALSVGGLAAAEPDPAAVRCRVVPVAGAVSMLEITGSGMVGNIGVLESDDGLLVVDNGYAPLAPAIEAALREIADKPLRWVIDTHWHGDHVGGNAAFQHRAPVIAQDNVRTRLAAGASAGGHTVPPAGPGALPVLTFGDTATLHLGGETVRLVHLPHAHTDGDTVVVFTRANVVHFGDVFVRYGFPFIDLDSGGSVRGMIAGIERVLAMVPADAAVIPGHGAPATVADVQAYLEMLRGTAARVEAALAAGRTLAQMKEENLLAGFEAWGDGAAAGRFLDTLHRDLSRR